ncbi:MAG: polynucleotide 5'-hydroxyl-kinase [Candidatus Omnitrophica bacterium]|nr:polynucleotide 5'-hydroxyl-kinase [Candidatus Omnitrophota bacterium]MCM8801995.1 polynucleotide 5'-hydroxyl-kinase [Candidatus Omnitrophota bacterium]
MEKYELLKKDDFEIFKSQEIKKIIFIGASDTGKTTLIKKVANYLIETNQDVIIFDCDIGQSHIGPPTTIGYAKLKQKIEDFYFEPDKFYFVGSISPSFAVVEFLTGIAKINQFLDKEESKILIDTTGYINDKLAISLKIYKIEILKPDFIFLLEKERELSEIENYLNNLSIKFRKIKVENIPLKSIEERFLYRKTRFLQYFRNLTLIFIDLKKISIKTTLLPTFTSFDNIEKLDLKGKICSLRDEFFNDICLGIIKEIKDKKIEIVIPKISFPIDKIKGINISSFNIQEYINF